MEKYWYGKYEIISYLNSLFENNNEVVINCRFDVLSNSHSFNNNEIINFIETNKNNNLTKNLFINNNNKPFCGMDNIYLGTIETQYKLISHLRFCWEKYYPCINISNYHYIYQEMF